MQERRGGGRILGDDERKEKNIYLRLCAPGGCYFLEDAFENKLGRKDTIYRSHLQVLNDVLKGSFNPLRTAEEILGILLGVDLQYLEDTKKLRVGIQQALTWWVLMRKLGRAD